MNLRRQGVRLAAVLMLACGSAETTERTEAPAPTRPTEPTPTVAPREEAPAPEPARPAPLVEAVLTQEQRDRLSPAEIVQALREGNERFVRGTVTVRDHTAQVRAAALGQWPKATVLSCIDSRVPVEDVFDRGIGDVFVARVAGNFENEDILGSMEFASAVAGTRVILVLGHENCGAIKGAIDGVEMGNLTATLANIRPAVEHFSDYTGEKRSTNPEFVQMVAEQNVRNTVADIRADSPILREREERGELIVVGAMYDMESGRVSFLDGAASAPATAGAAPTTGAETP